MKSRLAARRDGPIGQGKGVNCKVVNEAKFGRPNLDLKS